MEIQLFIRKWVGILSRHARGEKQASSLLNGI